MMKTTKLKTKFGHDDETVLMNKADGSIIVAHGQISQRVTEQKKFFFGAFEHGSEPRHGRIAGIDAEYYEVIGPL